MFDGNLGCGDPGDDGGAPPELWERGRTHFMNETLVGTASPVDLWAVEVTVKGKGKAVGSPSAHAYFIPRERECHLTIFSSSLGILWHTVHWGP